MQFLWIPFDSFGVAMGSMGNLMGFPQRHPIEGTLRGSLWFNKFFQRFVDSLGFIWFSYSISLIILELWSKKFCVAFFALPAQYSSFNATTPLIYRQSYLENVGFVPYLLPDCENIPVENEHNLSPKNHPRIQSPSFRQGYIY